jgi:hypothetical protein
MKKNYDYMFDRELINQRAIMIFHLFKSLKSTTKDMSPGDLCLSLYPQIDLIKFLDTIAEEDISREELSMRLGFWLQDNYFIFWLLTCECVDDLLFRNLVKYNKTGYLELSKKKRTK